MRKINKFGKVRVEGEISADDFKDLETLAKKENRSLKNYVESLILQGIALAKSKNN